MIWKEALAMADTHLVVVVVAAVVVVVMAGLNEPYTSMTALLPHVCIIYIHLYIYVWSDLFCIFLNI